MSAEQVMEIMKEAMLVAFEIAGPLLIISTFVPKLIVIALVLLALGSWMSKVMNEFVVELFAIMAAL